MRRNFESCEKSSGIKEMKKKKRIKRKRKYGPVELFLPLGRVPPDVAKLIHFFTLHPVMRQLLKNTGGIRHWFLSMEQSNPISRLYGDFYYKRTYRSRCWYILSPGLRRSVLPLSNEGSLWDSFYRDALEISKSVGVLAFLDR
jgi:hypothetical protein